MCHDLQLQTRERQAEQQMARREKCTGGLPPDSSALACKMLLADGKKCPFVDASSHYLLLHNATERHKRKRARTSDGGRASEQSSEVHDTGSMDCSPSQDN